MLKFIVTGLTGTFLGLAATQTLLDERVAFGGIEVGPWRVAPKTGSAEIDPYSRAQFARTGEIGYATVTQIEKKGKINRRVRIALAAD